jgi:Uma2 family endonuclease
VTAPLARKPVDPSAPNDPAVEAAFQAVPDTVIAQILDGELHAMPRPARPHANAASVLGGELHAPFRRGRGGPGGWVILDEPEIHLGPKPDKLVPDLAGWRRERMPDALGPGEASPYFYDLAPDWVCEILSPGTEAIDRGKKMRIYRREGVGHAWLIDPVEHTLEVYRLETGRWVLLDTFEEDALVRAEPFDAIALELALLWAR